MNRYTVEFFALCPVNGVRIPYRLTVETGAIIPAETLIEHVSTIKDGMHEDIADGLLQAFGGRQTLVAPHHGVTIETVRE